MNTSAITIPEIGSVWVAKGNALFEATIVWADEKTVVYDFSDGTGYRHRYCLHDPHFLEQYEPKRRTITVNGTELPEPIREALNEGEEYWVVDILERDGVCTDTWGGAPCELLLLRRGQVFRTKEDAQVWFEFEIKQRGGEV